MYLWACLLTIHSIMLYCQSHPHMTNDKCHPTQSISWVVCLLPPDGVQLNISTFIGVLSFKGTIKWARNFIIQFLNYFYFWIAWYTIQSLNDVLGQFSWKKYSCGAICVPILCLCFLYPPQKSILVFTSQNNSWIFM